MRLKTVRFLGATLMGLTLAAHAQQPATTAPHPREGTEWTVTYNYNANEEKLPRVLLIGDSICNGYQAYVRDGLSETAYVSFCATSKCVTDKTYLRQLAFILDEYDYAVIHFNNGLHSLATNNQDWERGLRAAIKLIKKKAPNAKIIWASSTPLKLTNLTTKVKELNAIAARVMTENGIPTDDLFALMDPLDRDANWSDTYHFKENGQRMQGKAVVDSVMALIGKHKAP